jgi:hypothetical protein
LHAVSQRKWGQGRSRRDREPKVAALAASDYTPSAGVG